MPEMMKFLRFGLLSALLFERNKSFTLKSPMKTVVDLQMKDSKESEKLWCSRRAFMAASSLSTAMLGENALHPSQAVAQEYDNSVLTATTYSEAPVIPFSTRRKYRHITLENGLRVLLVQDNQESRASVALSVGGAGQFQEDVDVGGLAHLLEHMVSSASPRDFEEWLADVEGASNAFTAPSMVCYHYFTPPEFFRDSLYRFSLLFQTRNVEKVCRNEAVIKREIRRVASELDFSSAFIQSLYLAKGLINPNHPFSRFTQGSAESLESTPKEIGVNVGEKLIELFKKRYQPKQSALVVIGPNNLDTLERWVSTFFSNVLSRTVGENPLKRDDIYPAPYNFPSPLQYKEKAQQYLLLRPNVQQPNVNTVPTENLSLQWFLDRRYVNDASPIVASTTAGFFISQIISRRGPASLSSFLRNRGWLTKGKNNMRLTFPLDVSGFQLMRVDLTLTLDGFANRSAVIAAFYDSLLSVSQSTGGTFNFPNDILKQYVTMARLHGYSIAPRPSDNVELAVDAQTYGMGGSSGVGVSGVWPLMPVLDFSVMAAELRTSVAAILRVMSDPSKAIIIVTQSENSKVMKSKSWQTELISGAKYFEEDMLQLPARIEEWIAFRRQEDGIIPLTYNPLLPTKLRPPRTLDRKNRISKKRFGKIQEIDTQSSSNCRLYCKGCDCIDQDIPELPLPTLPKEATCRSSLVIQLLSPRPKEANREQAAYAQLWLWSFEYVIQDLAELGVPGGLAYDLSFNKYGLRICILGISQNISAYTLRFCRRLSNQHNKLMLQKMQFEPELIERSVNEAKRQRSMSPVQKRLIEGIIRSASPQQASREGKEFLSTCNGAMCMTQGDILPAEALSIINSVLPLFEAMKTNTDDEEEQVEPVFPQLPEILYNPYWKPNTSLSCQIPGVPLISDACGRVRR